MQKHAEITCTVSGVGNIKGQTGTESWMRGSSFGKHQWRLPDLEDPLVKECNKNVEKDGQVGGGPKWE